MAKHEPDLDERIRHQIDEAERASAEMPDWARRNIKAVHVPVELTWKDRCEVYLCDRRAMGVCVPHIARKTSSTARPSIARSMGRSSTARPAFDRIIDLAA